MPVLACSHVRSAPAPCGVVPSRGLARVGASALGAEGIQGQCATELAYCGGEHQVEEELKPCREASTRMRARATTARRARSRTGRSKSQRLAESTAIFGGGVALDQLVGDRVEVLADVVRLRTDVQRRGCPRGG